MSAINGTEAPRFIIRNGTVTVEELELEITNTSGLVETYNDFTIRKRNIRGKIKGINKLKSIIFTLHYDEYLTMADGFKIEKIINHEYEGKRIYLMPRTDAPERIYEVKYTGEAWSMGVLPGGINSAGNRLPILSWETVELGKFNFIDTSVERLIVTHYETLLPA